MTSVARQASGTVTKELARHVSFKTTERYISLVDEDKRAAVDKIAVASALAGIDMTKTIGTVKKNPTPPSHTAEIGNRRKREKPLKGMVPRGGFEPPTRGFSVRCSTN